MSEPFPESPPPFDPSQPPPPYEAHALAYATPDVGPRKPVVVVVLAIIGIIIGGYGTLCTPVSLVMAMVQLSNASLRAANPAMATNGLLAWTIASNLVDIALSILLLASSIWSLMLKRWARKGMISWAWAKLAFQAIVVLASAVYVFPAMFGQIKTQMSASPSGPPPGYLLGIIIGTAVIVLLLGIALPILVLIFFRRQNVVAAFETGGAVTY